MIPQPVLRRPGSTPRMRIGTLLMPQGSRIGARSDYRHERTRLEQHHAGELPTANHLIGNLLKTGAEMRGTFQAQNFDRCRITPDMAEGLAMDRLLADRGNQHLHPVLFQNSGETHFAFFVSQHRRCAVEASVHGVMLEHVSQIIRLEQVVDPDNFDIGEILCRLPGEYRGELLVTSWADHRVERYTLRARGASFVADRKPFIQGGNDFRPVGLATAPDGSLVLIDEVLTPDSSRFWPADQYAPGKSQPSFDKQFVRDYLESIHWNKLPPGPALPAEIAEKTAEKYREAYRILSGRTL